MPQTTYLHFLLLIKPLLCHKDLIFLGRVLLPVSRLRDITVKVLDETQNIITLTQEYTVKSLLIVGHSFP